MNSLPSELLEQILSYVSKPSLTSCRLVCRSFSTISFHLIFSNVPLWLDYEYSHQSISSLAHDVHNRPAVMWSPWATGPDGPVDDVWLGIVWRVLIKSDPPGLYDVRGRSDIGGAVLTGDNFAELSGMKEISQNHLRTGQNRYLLHRAYTEGRDDSMYMTGGLF